MFTKLVVLTALAIAVSPAAFAQRAMVQHEDAYELNAANVILPRSAAGRVVFKTCNACNSQSMSVTTRTRYLIGQQSVPIDTFLAAVTKAQNANATHQTLIYVFYDTRTGQVNRLMLGLPLR